MVRVLSINFIISNVCGIAQDEELKNPRFIVTKCIISKIEKKENKKTFQKMQYDPLTTKHDYEEFVRNYQLTIQQEKSLNNDFVFKKKIKVLKKWKNVIINKKPQGCFRLPLHVQNLYFQMKKMMNSPFSLLNHNFREDGILIELILSLGANQCSNNEFYPKVVQIPANILYEIQKDTHGVEFVKEVSRIWD